MQTTSAELVPSQPFEERLFGRTHVVDDVRGFTRREADEGHVPFATAVVTIVVTSEADNGCPPKRRLLTRHRLHELDQRLSVALARLGKRIDEAVDARCGCFGLVFGHACLPGRARLTKIAIYE